ncbi:hypothetical protein J3R82DRAFT_1700 [Butyriboletus roseoflavus]|nr:hypothetical protein J3R82DRAFT_1700 [Butyriboletus roseoflavus]
MSTRICLEAARSTGLPLWVSRVAYGQHLLDTTYAFLPRTQARVDTSSQLSPEEQKAAIAVFSHAEAAQANGVRLAGQKFFTLQCSPEHLYGKKGASTAKIDIMTTFG